MSIFSTILDKLGIHKKEDKPAVTSPAPAPLGTAPKPPTTPKPSGTSYTPGGNYPSSMPLAGIPGAQATSATPATPATPAAPAPVEMVDVVSKLDKLAKASPIELNWRQSINDLMALLGMPHTGQDIKKLAVELGCPEKEMSDSYSRNVWTHKELLKQIAANGGNIPKNLLD